jgi:dsRNA-specific ribonuclease
MITTTGTGKSKKEAEQQAARRALAEFVKLHDTAPLPAGE